MTPNTEKQLRKAWLRQKFGSWEYHEELLRLHDDYLTSLKRHWSDPELQKRHPGAYRGMISPVFFNLDRISKPGTIPSARWKAGKMEGGKGSRLGQHHFLQFQSRHGLCRNQ